MWQGEKQREAPHGLNSIHATVMEIVRRRPLYTAVASVAEYLTRGLRSRLHLHNAIKASFAHSLTYYISISLDHAETPV